MHTPLRHIQRHATVLFFIAASAVVFLLTRSVSSEPVLLSVWAIAQGVGVVWIGSGAWDGRERWAVRAQATFIGIAVISIITSQQDAGVAAVGLLVFAVAALVLHFVHILTQALLGVQDSLTTVRGFARTEATRQSLFFATFAGPVALALAPNIVGVAFLVLTSLIVRSIVLQKARQRLATGLAREVVSE